MKSSSKRKLAVASGAIIAASLLPSCETTGDPTQGGIFWSEAKAQERLRQREQVINSINQDTQSQQAKSRQLEGEVYNERKNLNSY